MYTRLLYMLAKYRISTNSCKVAEVILVRECCYSSSIIVSSSSNSSSVAKGSVSKASVLTSGRSVAVSAEIAVAASATIPPDLMRGLFSSEPVLVRVQFKGGN